jgi:hypothetical protein
MIYLSFFSKLIAPCRHYRLISFQKLIVLAGVVAVALCWSGQVFAERPVTPLSRSVTMTVQPVSSFLPSEPDRDTFGALRFVGGLILSGQDEDFGGFSGLVFLSNDHIVAVTDKGLRLDARLKMDINMKPLALEQSVFSPLYDETLQKPLLKDYADAESLTILNDSIVVGFERRDALRLYKHAQKTSQTLPLPDFFASQTNNSNKGLEALATLTKGRYAGRLLLISEESLDRFGNIVASIGYGKRAKPLTLLRRQGYSATGADTLPNGDVIILERRFAFSEGIYMRLRRIPAEKIYPGAVMDGPVLYEANMRHVIDNMEAVSITEGADGKVFLTLLSDDNFSFFQRTLLLRFELIGEGEIWTPPMPRKKISTLKQ